MPDSNIKFTPNLDLSLLPANYRVWAQIMNDNLTVIDAAINGFVQYHNLRGVWSNSTHYAVGDTVIDAFTAVVWTNDTDHISSPIPDTFADDRVRYPTYWRVANLAAAARGEWTGPGTAYNVNDFVLYNGVKYAMCLVQHISSASFDADAALGYWAVLFDISNAGSSASVGSTPPTNPAPNQLWWNSDLGQLFIYYNDGNSAQWVPATPTDNSSTGIIDVRLFGAVLDGVVDDTAAINAALTAGAGGVVWIPQGNAKISETLFVPPATTLRGVGACDILVPLEGGSTISITHTGSPGISLGRGATLEGIAIWYPDQVTTASPVVYDYAITSNISDPFQSGNNAGITIRDIVIHNAYRGINFDGDVSDGSPNTGAIIVQGVRLYAIDIGMRLATTASEVNVSDCIWSPIVWTASNGQPIRLYTNASGTACWLQSSGQGAQFSNCTFFGHKRGIYLFDAGVPSLDRAQCNFMKVTGCLFDGLHRGVEVTDKFGFGGAVFTGCQFLMNNSFDTAVVDGIGFYSNNSQNLNIVTLSGCQFLGSRGYHVTIDNDAAAAGTSWYQFDGCYFFSANSSGTTPTPHNIYCDDPRAQLQITGCQFQNPNGAGLTNIRVVAAASLMVTGCDIYDASSTPFNVTSVTSRMNIRGNTVRSFNAGTWPATGTTIHARTAAAALALGESDVGIFLISGSTGITSITPSWCGRRVTLKFANAPTVTDGGNLKLTADFVAGADDTLDLVCDGTNWYEVSRSAN